MTNKKIAVLLIGFGGPTSMAEVRPFFQSVLQGAHIPQSRVDEVLHHYEVFNGVSPYNSTTYKQKESLEKWFKEKNIALPVLVGFLHTKPTFEDVFAELKRNGVEKVIGFVLSPFRCQTSFEKYLYHVNESKKITNAASIEIDTTGCFHSEPLFLKAQAENVRIALKHFLAKDIEHTFFLFSAHSVPVRMSDESGYAKQFYEAASRIAEKLGLSNWDIAYQSRSGNPSDPWLSPDVKEKVEGLDDTCFKNVMLIPVGFLCDNVEVLYDLDVDAKDTAETMGFKYFRASTVADHPKFIEMMGMQVMDTLKALKS